MKKSYSSKDIISMLEKDGWIEVNQVGSHKQFKHQVKKGKVSVNHPVKDMHIKTLKSIEKQAGLKF
ncbi:MAG: type II toxin-antitoxin system HicA family toxin [Defluviitaleaceae bacterium]|nr:type II toxin-antitoxin system HicA family toxin [Defluviitaleaceae bacterium]